MCLFLNPLGFVTLYLQRKGSTEELVLVPLGRCWLRIWIPKWLRKVLRWLKLRSSRGIGMIPPARIVCVGEWIIDWPRETLACLHLFLNKFWVLCSHGTITNKVSWTEIERTHFLLGGWCEGWDSTSSYGKNLVHFWVNTSTLLWMSTECPTREHHFSFGWSVCGHVRARNRNMMHWISLNVSKSSYASFSFLVMNVPPHDASTICQCDSNRLW